MMQVLDFADPVFAEVEGSDAGNSLQVLNFFDFVGAQFEHVELREVQIFDLHLKSATFLILLLSRYSFLSFLRWEMFSITFILLYDRSSTSKSVRASSPSIFAILLSYSYSSIRFGKPCNPA